MSYLTYKKGQKEVAIGLGDGLGGAFLKSPHTYVFLYIKKNYI